MKLLAYIINRYHYHFVGRVDPACLLEQCELQIVKVKEEALSRKELLTKVEKWLAACQEERWLEEYNKVGHFIVPFL